MLFSLKHEAKSIRLENLHEHFKGWSIAETMAMETAYSEVPWFRAALDHRANAFANVPFDLMKLGGDTVVATESDYEDELDANPVLNIFRVLAQMVTDLDMYGAAYADYDTNEYGLNGAWRRLHPSTIVPRYNTVTGELICFERRISGKMEVITLDDPDFFWLWMPERKMEYCPGEGVGKTALRAATTLNNTDIFQATFFKNGALNPTILQIKGWATTDQVEKERVQGLFTRMMTGIANAFKIVPLDADVKVQSLMQNLKDMAMMELTQQQRENISTATGVPHSLLFSNAANFATAQQDDFNFYDKTIIPLATRIVEQQLNERFFKRLGYRLKYRKERMEVYQRLEIDKSDKLLAIYNAGLMDGNEVRLQVGLPEREDDDFEVPERLIDKGTDTQDTQDEESNTQGQKPDAENRQAAKKALEHQKPAFAYIPLPNNPDLMRIIRNLKERLTDERIVWQAAPTYHITLCYATMVSDKAIDEMAQQLRAAEFDIYGAYMDVFETPDGKALHIRLDSTEPLMNLQRHVYETFEGVADGLSEFSKPEDYKPHITLAYLPNDMAWERQVSLFRDSVDCVIVGRDDYEPALIVEAPQRDKFKSVTDEMKTDFQKWERLALKRLEEGKPDKMLSFKSEAIPAVTAAAVVGALEAAKDATDVKNIFAHAVEVAPLWAAYA